MRHQRTDCIVSDETFQDNEVPLLALFDQFTNKVDVKHFGAEYSTSSFDIISSHMTLVNDTHDVH